MPLRSSLLADHLAGRDNNYNLLRVLAAFAVLYSHSFDLVNLPKVEPLVSMIGITASRIGVDIFFIISGFLVARSFFYKKSLIMFIRARVLRVYPALIISTLFCVFCVGWYFTTLPTQDYFTDPITQNFLSRNITLFSGVKYELPGVFAANQLSAVNGSLWTLPYEVKLYTYLALIGSLLFFIKKKWPLDTSKFITLSIAVTLTSINIYTTLITSEKWHFIHLAAMFSLGSTYFFFAKHIRLSLLVFIIVCGLLIVSSYNFKFFFSCYSLALPYLVLFLAYIPNGIIRKYNELGDVSYGIYIYAFPIQQSLISLIPGITIYQLMISAFAVTLCLAILSWKLIEQPALKFK